MAATLAALILALAAGAGGEPRPLDSAVRDRVKEGIDVALTHLRWRQAADGSWSGDAATTALVLRAFVDSHRKYREDDGPFIRRPIAFLTARLTSAGSVGDGPRAALATAATVLALEAADRARYGDAIARGRDWLRSPANAARGSEPYVSALLLEAAGAGPQPASSIDGDRYSTAQAVGPDDLERLAALARALHARGQAMVTDAAGAAHDWRVEIATRVLALQRKDGGWGSDEATALALDALELLYNRPL